MPTDVDLRQYQRVIADHGPWLDHPGPLEEYGDRESDGDFGAAGYSPFAIAEHLTVQSLNTHSAGPMLQGVQLTAGGRHRH